MAPLARDDEQVAYWRRHTHLGVALCLVLPSIIVLRALTSPSAPHRTGQLLLAAAVALPAPLILLVPVARVVRHRWGRLFFDGWEVLGVSAALGVVLLDGGARSPYVLFLYVLLAHAALAYPPAGLAIAGSVVIGGYVAVGALAGGVPPQDLLTGALCLAVATSTCAFASYSHVRLYRRTAAYARQIAALAETDGLTGCLNHRTFHSRLQAAAADAGPDRPLALLIVDVDHFKRVNDTWGHPAGDAVLQRIGGVLRDLSRAGDAAGRLGGDEFALLLPGTGLAEAEVVGRRLCARVTAVTAPHGVTVSVGAAATAVGAGATELLAAADRAVYAAKRGGRDRVACADAPAGHDPAPVPARR